MISGGAWIWALIALGLMTSCLSSAADITPAREPWLRKRLDWFQDMKLGFFVHWGIYSQWGCIESWPLVEEDTWARPDHLTAWTERNKDIDRFRRDYFHLHRTFHPTRFDPGEWVAAAKSAGMKYFVFTTKHHDGFSMFDTKWSDFRITSPDCPFHDHPRANVTRELFDAFRKEGFGIGAYFSKADWHHPDYWSPDAPAHTRNPNYDTLENREKWDRFVRFVHGQIEELMTGYGRIDILWLDAGQVRPPTQDIRMNELAAAARNRQPGLIVVDRTVGGEHENYHTPEQEVPDRPLDTPWESCITMGDQWSYRPDDRYKTTRQLVHLLVDIVAKGGNLLLNVGPKPDGTLPGEAVTRMKELGEWLRVNGAAIYGTRPFAPYKEGSIAYTRKGATVNAILLLPEGDGDLPARISLPSVQPSSGSKVRMLGTKEALKWSMDGEGSVVEIPESIRTNPPSLHAVVLSFRAAGAGPVPFPANRKWHPENRNADPDGER